MRVVGGGVHSYGEKKQLLFNFHIIHDWFPLSLVHICTGDAPLPVMGPGTLVVIIVCFHAYLYVCCICFHAYFYEIEHVNIVM